MPADRPARGVDDQDARRTLTLPVLGTAPMRGAPLRGDPVLADPLLPGARRRADGATLAALFALSLLIIPARLVLRGLPLSLTPANILSLLAGMCWLCAQFTTTLGVAKGRTPVRTALFCYVVALTATYGVASYGYLPSDELKLSDHALVLVMASVGIALAVCDGVRTPERLDFLLKTMVTGGAVIAVIGALQFMADFDLTQYLALPGLRFASEGGAVDMRDSMRRVAATTGHPIEFGVLCSMLLPLAVHYGFRGGRGALRWWLCAALIGMGLLFSVSRSAVLGVGVVGIILILGWPVRRKVQALIVTAVFLVVAKLTFPGLLNTLYGLFANAGTDSSVQYRTHDYDVAATEVARHLWLGRGIGTWYAPKYQVFDNQYILTAVESGAVGVAVFVALFFCGIYSAVRARRLSVDPAPRDLGLTLAACLVVPLVGSATFDLLSFATVTGVAFLLIGASGALLRSAQREAAVRAWEDDHAERAPGRYGAADRAWSRLPWLPLPGRSPGRP
ncbi:O-antigen ligase [Microbispora sp. H10830]|uniref:O-antigen ligase family protein n=1 Tax=Microbispora sp. H10830 TaxID=2729109 RepID=UPI00217595F8|nr:O-antigen ligase family protein [Microbispora sp. H10830]